MNQRSTGLDDLDVTSLRWQHEVRVLVVDDHAVFRGILRDLVAATPGFIVVGEAACGEEALAASDALSPEFVLMDVRMPRVGGVEAARRMMERDPHLVVLLVSAQELPDLPLAGLSGSGMSFAHKWDLRGALLQEIWEGRSGVR
jgi:two-component system, NarL family, invasion response regulator UvrY